MRFRGKVAVWVWGVFIGGEVLFAFGFISPRESWAVVIWGILLYHLIFVPILVRNYVVVDGDFVTVVFGLSKNSMRVGEVEEVYRTHNPVSSSAASLDRIVIRGRRGELVCSVRERERFLKELKRANENIVMR